MMKKRVFYLALLPLLVGCSTKPELRKDIEKFISKFSLSKAIEQYPTGGYKSTRIETKGDKTDKEVVEFEFSTVDKNHPQYSKITTKYENEVQTSQDVVTFVEIESGSCISTNGELKEATVKDCNKLIIKFFYKKTELDGQYHTGGQYYGDYLKESAPYLQKYVTIDKERELYIMEYTVNETKSGVTTEIHQRYEVNKWGMMEHNYYSQVSENHSITQEIIVHNQDKRNH